MNVERSVVRLEEALYDLGRTATYPSLSDPSEGILAAVAAPPARRLPRPRVGRPLLVAVLVLLALAGVAAAAYVIGTAWLSTGPRGIQFSDDFTFAEVYRDGGEPTEPGPMPRSVHYLDVALSHDGAAIYAVRMPNHPEPSASLIRLIGLAGPALEREEVFDYADLADPALWDQGVELSAADIGVIAGSADALTVTADGQLFLAAAAYGRERIPIAEADALAQEVRDNWPDLPPEELDAQIELLTTRQPILSAAVIVVRPDGSRQKVLTVAELVESGFTGPAGAAVSLSMAASAPDRLWVKAETLGDAAGLPTLLQVTDPDGDGDWLDRMILPLAVSDSLPDPGAGWRYLGPTAEISSSQVDRSQSVLVPMLSSSGEYRIYRVRDDNGDGDATDEGEAQLVVTGQPGLGDMGSPIVSSRVLMDGEAEVLRELLVSGLTGPTRIARVLEDGTMRDIARAIEIGPEEILAAPDGTVYVTVQEPGSATSAPASVMYRLTPPPEGEAASSDPARSDAVLPPSTADTDGPAGGGPRIAYTLESASGAATSRLMVVSADGDTPTELIPGDHNSAFCASADGSLIAYWSDEEVPHESFVYVANADGSGTRKISEDAGEFWCGFSADGILLRGRAADAPIVRRDLVTGEETELLHGAERLEASPDGRRYLAAIAGEEGTTLEILDATTGDRVRLDGPLADDLAFVSLSWAPDGSLVAYAVGPQLGAGTGGGPSEIRIVALADGVPRRIAEIDGSEPGLALSADVRHLLLTPSPTTGPGPLLLVEVETGETRTVTDVAHFGDWHPAGSDTFAYATPDALLIGTIHSEPTELLAVPSDGVCPECDGDGAPPGEWGWGTWIGWSPDGRYIGLPDFAPVVAVVDVATGELRILTSDVADAFVFGARWLP